MDVIPYVDTISIIGRQVDAGNLKIRIPTRDVGNHVMLETGDHLLLETGDKLLQE